MTTLGNLIDLSGIEVEVDHDEIISDIVVVAEVTDINGRSRMAIRSGQTNWLKENGMLDIAHKMTSSTPVKDN